MLQVHCLLDNLKHESRNLGCRKGEMASLRMPVIYVSYGFFYVSYGSGNQDLRIFMGEGSLVDKDIWLLCW